jgi:isopentenyl phosphate kinase
VALLLLLLPTTTTTNIQRRRRRRRISRVIFITDVAGIFTSDPKFDVNAQLLRYIQIDTNTGEIRAIEGRRNESGNESDNGVMDTKTNDMNVTGSSHDHDVTGGLKVRRFCVHYTDLILSHCRKCLSIQHRNLNLVVMIITGKAGSSRINRTYRS